MDNLTSTFVTPLHAEASGKPLSRAPVSTQEAYILRLPSVGGTSTNSCVWKGGHGLRWELCAHLH